MSPKKIQQTLCKDTNPFGILESKTGEEETFPSFKKSGKCEFAYLGTLTLDICKNE